MDIYVIMQVIILFGAIFLGVRLGGMGIGYAGGLGVVLLSLSLIHILCGVACCVRVSRCLDSNRFIV